MSIINSKTNYFLTPFLFTILFFGCNPQGTNLLSVKSIELCDNFDALANCTEPKPKIGIVKLKQTSSEKEKENWENFANYLYFTARETPGFVITFVRQFSENEKREFSTQYSAYLSLDGIREKMEGYEIGNDKVASFHYLGSLIKEVKRHQKLAKVKPDLEKDGNFLLQFEFHLPDGSSNSIQREVKLEWEKE